MAASLTQEELAEQASLSVRGISDIERGIITRPRPYTVRQLIDALQLSANDRDALLVATTGLGENASAAQPPYNLPFELTPLVGREREEAHALHLLRWGGVRLLTFTGPGGVGKTRLAQTIAEAMHRDCPDGILMVALAPVRDPDLVIPTLASALGLHEETGKPLLATVAAYLRERSMLLLLDNFEQITNAAPHAVELLLACPRLRILVTSRVPLHVRGEHELEVLPLAVPDRRTGRLSPLEPLLRFPSIALFVQRAQAVKPEFRLTEENATDIAQLCRSLDGLPLAIELAAAHAKFLSPRMLVTQLDHQLDVLTTSAQDLPPRQRTLRDAIAWSYDLLTTEQKLFRRLAVFADGCDVEAVTAVCAGPDGLALDPLRGLLSLVDKSLLTLDDQTASDMPRFRMLETIRAFGLEQLDLAGERDEVARRHAGYFRDLAEQAESQLIGANPEVWLARLEREHDNFRTAIAWACGHDELETGLRLAGALLRFWGMRGYWSEGRGWLERILSAAGTTELPAQRAKALWALGVLTMEQGIYDEATRLLTESLMIFQDLEDDVAAAGAFDLLGMTAQHQGDYERAAASYAAGVDLCQRAGNRHGLAMGLRNLGVVAGLRGEYERAASLLEDSLQLFRDIGHVWGVARVFTDLGRVKRTQGHREPAARLFAESFRLHHQVGYKPGIATALVALAGIAFESGEPVRAARLGGAAAIHWESADSPIPPSERIAFDQLTTTLQASLAKDEFDSTWETGRKVTTEQLDMLVRGGADAGVTPYSGDKG